MESLHVLVLGCSMIPIDDFNNSLNELFIRAFLDEHKDVASPVSAFLVLRLDFFMLNKGLIIMSAIFYLNLVMLGRVQVLHQRVWGGAEPKCSHCWHFGAECGGLCQNADMLAV